MLRLGCQSSKAMLSRSSWLLGGRTPKPDVRHSSSAGGGRAKILGSSLTISAGTMGGVVGYSALDPDFRKTVEENIPGSAKLMYLMLGEREHLIEKDELLEEVSAFPIEEPKVSTSAPELLEVLEVPASPMVKPKDAASAAEPTTILKNPSSTAEKPKASAYDPEMSAVLEITDPHMEKQEILAVETETVVESGVTEAEAAQFAAAEALPAEAVSIAAEDAEAEAATEAEASRVAAEKAVVAAAARIAAEDAAATEAARIAADEAAAEKVARIAAEKVAAAESLIIAVEEAAAAEAARIAAEESPVADAVRIAATEVARIAAEDAAAAETARIAAEATAVAEAVISTSEEVAAAEASIIAEEDAEATRNATEEAAAADATRVAAEEAAVAEAARIAAEEAAAADVASITEEETAAAEAARITAEEAAEPPIITTKEAAVAKAARISAEENAVSDEVTDPPKEKQNTLACATELQKVLEDPSPTLDSEVTKGLGIPSLFEENKEAQASDIKPPTVLDIPVEKPKVLASSPEMNTLLNVSAPSTEKPEAPDSAPEWSMVLKDTDPSLNKASAPGLFAALEVSAPLMETSDARVQPSIIEVSAPLENLASAIDPPLLLEDSLEKPKALSSDPENSVILVITDPPIPASANELSTLLGDPVSTCAREQPIELAIPSLCMEKPKVPASDPELAEVLEVLTPPMVRTEDPASAFDPPTVEKPKASSSDPDMSALLDVIEPPIKNYHIPASATVLEDPAPKFASELPTVSKIPSLCVKKPEAQASEISKVPPPIGTPEDPASTEVSAEETDLKKNTENKAAVDTLCPKEPSAADHIPDRENNSLEKLLVELCMEMQEMVACAVSEYEAYSDAAVTHINLMQKLLEVNLTDKDDSDWNEMLLAAQVKSAKAKAAERGEKEALYAITNLVDSINTGRMNQATSNNPELLVAEEAANRSIYQMDLAKDRRVTVQSDDRVKDLYKELVRVVVMKEFES